MDTDDTPTFGIADDEGRHAAGPAAQTPLDALRSEAKRKVRLPFEDLSVPERPGWGMRFDPNKIDGDSMKRWANASVTTNRRQRRQQQQGEVDLTNADQLKFSQMVLQAAHTAFLWQAEGDDEWQVVVLDETDDRPLSLKDDEFLDMVGAATPGEALRLWYGVDGHLLQAANEVVIAAGFGEGDVNPLMAQ